MHCVYCDSTENYLRGEKQGYSIYVCRRCKFEFVYPLPIIPELESIYNYGMNKGLGERIKSEIMDLDSNKNHAHWDWFISIIKNIEQISGRES